MALLAIAIADTGRDQRAEAAASVLGPLVVGQLVDALRIADAVASDRGLPYDKAADDRRQALLSRVDHTPAASLLKAVQARSDAADSNAIALFAEIILVVSAITAAKRVPSLPSRWMRYATSPAIGASGCWPWATCRVTTWRRSRR